MPVHPLSSPSRQTMRLWLPLLLLCLALTGCKTEAEDISEIMRDQKARLATITYANGATRLVAVDDALEGKLKKRDPYRLYPPFALTDPFVGQIYYGATVDAFPASPWWYALYRIVNRPDECGDDFFTSVFAAEDPPIRWEAEPIPFFPAGRRPTEEENQAERERMRAYWKAQSVKLWGSESVLPLRKAFKGYFTTFCDFDTTILLGTGWKESEELLARAAKLGGVDAAYLHIQAILLKVSVAWGPWGKTDYKEYSRKFKGGLLGRLEEIAQSGSPEATLHLARCFYFGNLCGIAESFENKMVYLPRDLARSVQLAERSLQMGCIDSLPFLNTIYADPEAPCFDLRKAHAAFIAHEGLKQHYRISRHYFDDESVSERIQRNPKWDFGPVKPRILRGYADKLSPDEVRSAEEEGQALIKTHLPALEAKKKDKLKRYARWRVALMRDIDKDMSWLRFLLLPKNMTEDLRDRMYVWAVEKGLAEKTGPRKEDIRLKRALTWDDYVAMDHEYRMQKWNDIFFLFRWRYPKPGEVKPNFVLWANWTPQMEQDFRDLIREAEQELAAESAPADRPSDKASQ